MKSKLRFFTLYIIQFTIYNKNEILHFVMKNPGYDEQKLGQNTHGYAQNQIAGRPWRFGQSGWGRPAKAKYQNADNKNKVDVIEQAQTHDEGEQGRKPCSMPTDLPIDETQAKSNSRGE